jgi:hypothetical protein
MAREEVFDYHLYSLGQPTTILDNQTKQVALLAAAGVAVRKEYLSGRRKPGTTQSPGFGPRPQAEDRRVRGVRQCRRRSRQAVAQGRGAGVQEGFKAATPSSSARMRIDHTAKNDRVRLKMGDAFDVTATRKQTGYLLAGRPNPVL